MRNQPATIEKQVEAVKLAIERLEDRCDPFCDPLCVTTLEGAVLNLRRIPALVRERDAAIALADDLREDADADQANLAELNRLLYRLQHESENLRQHIERLVKESQRRHRHCCGHDHDHAHHHERENVG